MPGQTDKQIAWEKKCRDDVVRIDAYYKAELLLPKLVDNAWDSDEHDSICNGSTSKIMIVDETTVFKSSLSQHADRQEHSSLLYFQSLEAERLAYKRLGKHPHICEYLYDVRDGIVLRRYKTCMTVLLMELAESGGRFETARVVKWSIQLAQALNHIHTRGVIHCDISCNNLLISNEDDLLLCDFGGSSIDGSSNTVIYDTRFCKHDVIPTPTDSRFIPWEIFALGSVIYQISSGRKPYEEKSDREVEKLYRQKTFPDVNDLHLGQVIAKCWHGSYDTATDAAHDLQQMIP